MEGLIEVDWIGAVAESSVVYLGAGESLAALVSAELPSYSHSPDARGQQARSEAEFPEDEIAAPVSLDSCPAEPPKSKQSIRWQLKRRRLRVG